jgi:hypothetical protein
MRVVVFLCCVIYVFSFQMTNIGDSWGTHGSKVFQKKVKEINSTTTAGIYAVGGSTAHFWVNSGVQVLQKMFRENPNLSHIWLTVGGNGKPNKYF